MAAVSLAEYLADADARLDFVRDALAVQSRLHPEIPRGEILRKRTFLRSTVGPDEPELLDRAAEIAEKGTPADLESLRPEVRRIREKLCALPPQDPVHCFRYEVNDAGQCYFHIHNPAPPKSFLDDPAYVASEFRRIMDLAEREHGCTELFTATWLNSLDRFLAYLPEEWRRNMKQPPADEVGPTLGWQGQFINRYGLLNRKTAAYYVEHGVLAYRRCTSFCTFAAMREHLAGLQI